MRKLYVIPAAVAVAALGFASATEAAVVFNENGSTQAAYVYYTQSYGEIKDSNGNNLTDGGVINSSSNPLPAQSQVVNLSNSGTSLTSTVSSSLTGFAQARAFASAQVTNANSSFGYTAIASQGARTQVQFNSAATPGRVDFVFNVTGNINAPFGAGIMRLDFLVTGTPDGNLFDVFGAGALHASGPGTFTYTYIGSTAAPLDVMFWAAAGALIGTPVGVGAAPNGANGTVTANFGNTFDLVDINLFADAAGTQAINQWNMTDLQDGSTAFNQDGRVTAVSEPHTLMLFGAGLGIIGFALMRRRRRD